MNGLEGALAYLKAYDGPVIDIMEVCGTHTATAVRGGIHSLLGDRIRLLSGPGCPVCLAGSGYIDRLSDYACDGEHIVATFGDLLKVRGSRGSLLDAKARGGRVEMVYSPLMALELAKKHPESTVVMAAVGFETTAPSYALIAKSAEKEGVGNLRFLTALKRMPPALDILCTEGRVDGFIAPGHVAAIIGSDAFWPISERAGKPFAVAGFTPESMIAAICWLVRKIERGQGGVHNLYGEVVRPEGNLKALRILDTCFKTGDAYWRGLGTVIDSGFYLKGSYARFDAGSEGLVCSEEEPKGCRCAEVLTGKIEPDECPLFGRACTPAHAVGPCMVSSEGACGIWYTGGMNT